MAHHSKFFFKWLNLLGKKFKNRLQVCTPFPQSILAGVLWNLLACGNVPLDEVPGSGSCRSKMPASQLCKSRPKPGHEVWANHIDMQNKVLVPLCTFEMVLVPTKFHMGGFPEIVSKNNSR